MSPKFGIVLTFILALSAQAQRVFPVPEPPRAVTITAIPGVIAAGAKWELVWQGAENADGLIAWKGGILFAQEQSNHVMRLDEKGKVSIFSSANGPGALAIGPPMERLFAVERTCTDPGGEPDLCKEQTDVAVVLPDFHTPLVNGINGKLFGRLNDIVADRKGSVYFTDGPGPGGKAYHLVPAKTITAFAENLRTNGIMLSRDEKTLYVTNGPSIVAFDVGKDGTPANPHEFAKLSGGVDGDGMAIDEAGRIYDATSPGVQVFSPQGQFLGLIPTPRIAISIAFSGPGKKVLYASCTGALGPDGKEITTRAGIRNTAMSIYKIQMEAEGFKGRPK
jgi:gluconolactonase